MESFTEIWCPVVKFLKLYHEEFRSWTMVVGTVLGILFFWWRNIIFTRATKAAEEQNLISRNQTLISEKASDDKAFLDAIRVFESVNEDARIGAILALERMSNEKEVYNEQILKVFFGFIRNNSNEGRKDKDTFYMRADIRESLEVLKRKKFERRENQFSLQGSYLAGASFIFDDFKRILFKDCNLHNAEFRKSDFIACNFGNSKLKGAKFVETKLLAANFFKCDLTSALFFRNEMTSCNFLHAKLIGTRFEKIEKNIFKSIINSLKQAVIIYEGKPLANAEKFHYSYKENEGKSTLDLNRETFYQHVENLEVSSRDFDTQFPDYVEIIPLPGDRFDLKISGGN